MLASDIDVAIFSEESLKRIKNQSVLQILNVFRTFDKHLDKVKLKNLELIFPAVVKQYHEESIFDLRLNPTDMVGMLSPSDPDHQASASFTESSLNVTVPMTLDLLVGETLVRKLIC